ncbi:hypothetical protein FA95DRAFT_219039 [Auriscalpium vulgare]|uniref:Uncharacterized protein n=1 Tax=Auriscalpium vulgare TaxID=40419 RepID=A0ACB8RLA4_9AGAM|nr:hypothetical protein FA95DRAFT_219039 [Auriscalpium vulgare]
MADVPIDVATLWSLLCSSIFYGVHVVTFGNAVWVMIIKRRRQARRPHLIGVAFVLFAIGTAYLALAFRRILNAFVFFQGPGGAKGQLEQISDMLASVKGSLFITQILTGDMILIYRCFVVYGKDWRAIILPIVLWLGFAIIGAFVVYIPFTLHVHAVLSVARLEPFLISATSLTLAINVFCTSLIVRRIWLAQQQSLRMFSTGGVIQSFRRTIGIIVESAAMYTMTITIFFALELSKNNAEYIVAEYRANHRHRVQLDHHPRRSRTICREPTSDRNSDPKFSNHTPAQPPFVERLFVFYPAQQRRQLYAAVAAHPRYASPPVQLW